MMGRYQAGHAGQRSVVWTYGRQTMKTFLIMTFCWVADDEGLFNEDLFAGA